jgi:hypothetical protein
MLNCGAMGENVLVPCLGDAIDIISFRQAGKLVPISLDNRPASGSKNFHQAGFIQSVRSGTPRGGRWREGINGRVYPIVATLGCIWNFDQSSDQWVNLSNGSDAVAFYKIVEHDFI